MKSKRLIHMIQRACQLPASFLIAHGLRTIKRRLRGIPRARLSRSLKADTQAPFFPFDFIRSQLQGTVESADRIVAHEFSVLGSGPVNLGTHLPWHRDFIYGYDYPQIESHKIHYEFDAGHDIKVPWELSRFQFLPTLIAAYEKTHDEKYAQSARELIADWIDKNPVGIGVNWKCTMDVAIRAANWALAWHFLKKSPAWHAASTVNASHSNWQTTFLQSILDHGVFIEHTLEYGPGFNSNHFLADVSGLAWLGILFPEFTQSSSWKKIACKALEGEMKEQIYPDGIDFEASTSYHRLVTEFFGWSTLLGMKNGINFSASYLDRLQKMFTFVHDYTPPSGVAPLIGDNDDGRFFILEDYFAWERRDHRHLFSLEEALFPEEKKLTAQNPHQSAAYPHGGIYILRSKTLTSIIDCGANGQANNGGHAHNDTLSFTLSIGAEDFLIDPGTYTYTSDAAMRNHFRSTRMHNTVMVDDVEMNRFEPHTLFSLKNDAQPKVEKWQSTKERDTLVATHNGYSRLASPVMHKRSFELDKMKNTFLVTDHFLRDGGTPRTGANEHTFEWNFHFSPETQLTKKADVIEAGKNGTILTLHLPKTIASHATIVTGEVAPSYGVMAKAPVLRLRYVVKEIDHLPALQFIFTWISS